MAGTQFRQSCGQIGPLLQAGAVAGTAAFLADAPVGAGPAGPPLRQVQGARQPIRRCGPLLQGGGQGGGMGGELLQQPLAQGRILAAQGIERIGAGGGGREAAQQLLPASFRRRTLLQGLGPLGLLLDHHCRQPIAAPALAVQ